MHTPQAHRGQELRYRSLTSTSPRSRCWLTDLLLWASKMTLTEKKKRSKKGACSQLALQKHPRRRITRKACGLTLNPARPGFCILPRQGPCSCVGDQVKGKGGSEGPPDEQRPRPLSHQGSNPECGCQPCYNHKKMQSPLMSLCQVGNKVGKGPRGGGQPDPPCRHTGCNTEEERREWAKARQKTLKFRRCPTEGDQQSNQHGCREEALHCVFVIPVTFDLHAKLDF